MKKHKTYTTEELLGMSERTRTNMLVFFIKRNHPHIEYLQRIIDCGVNYEVKENRKERTLLHSAVYYNRHKIAKILIDAGIDVNAKDKFGQTALHFCSSIKGRIEMAKILLENGADVNAQTNNGWTPLHYCAKRGLLALAEFLIEHRARRGLANAKGYLPYDYAKYRSHKKIFSF